MQPDAVARAQGRGPLDGAAEERQSMLPLDPTKKTAVIGPLAKTGHDMLGPWWGTGNDKDAVTVFDGINAQSPGATYAKGCDAAAHRAAAVRPRG